MANHKKIEEVKHLTEKIKSAKAIVMLNYKGINCQQLNKLRKIVSQTANIEYLVAKNRLFKIALKNAKIEEDFDEILKGPTSFILSYEDVMIAPKISKEFKDESNLVEVKGGFIENRIVDADLIRRLSVIPSKEVLVAQLMSLMNNPLARLSNVLTHLSKVNNEKE